MHRQMRSRRSDGRWDQCRRPIWHRCHIVWESFPSSQPLNLNHLFCVYFYFFTFWFDSGFSSSPSSSLFWEYMCFRVPVDCVSFLIGLFRWKGLVLNPSRKHYSQLYFCYSHPITFWNFSYSKSTPLFTKIWFLCIVPLHTLQIIPFPYHFQHFVLWTHQNWLIWNQPKEDSS